jgi:hypothetical protein
MVIDITGAVYYTISKVRLILRNVNKEMHTFLIKLKQWIIKCALRWFTLHNRMTIVLVYIT